MFLLDKMLCVHYDVTACVKIFDCVVRKLCTNSMFDDEHEQCLKTNFYPDYIVS